MTPPHPQLFCLECKSLWNSWEFEAQIHKDIAKKYLASRLFPWSLMTFGNLGLRHFLMSSL